jgi:hypothetical protein
LIESGVDTPKMRWRAASVCVESAAIECTSGSTVASSDARSISSPAFAYSFLRSASR